MRTESLLLWIIVLLTMAGSLQAEEQKPIPVEVTGQFLEYKNKRQIVIIKGDVLATYQDWRIECDTLQVNIKKEKMFAFGKVLVVRTQDEITGDFFVYNLKTGEGYIRNAVIHKGVQFFRAREIILEPDRIQGCNLAMTTCDDPTHPHWQVTVDEIINVPDRTNTMKGQRLKVLGKTVFAMGLNKGKVKPKVPRDQQQEQPPKGQGYSQQNGLFLNIANKFKILGNQADYSANITQKQGTKGAFNFGYSTKKFGSGSTSSSFFYNPAREQNNVSMNFTNSGDVPFYDAIPILGKYLKRPSYNFNARYYSDQIAGNAENQELNTSLNFTTSMMGANITAQFDKRSDPDGDKYEADNNLQYINKNPEIKVRMPSFSVGDSGLKFDTDLTYSKLFESRIQRETTKKEYNVKFTNPSIDMGPKMNLNISGGFQHRDYSEGEKQDISQLSVRTNQKWGHGFSSQFNYDIEKIKGETPLSFDNRITRDRVQGSVNYNIGKRFSSTLLYFVWDAAQNQINSVYQNFKLIQKDEETTFPWEINLRPTYSVLGEAQNARIGRIRLANLNTQFRITRNKYKLDVNGLFDGTKGKYVNMNTNLGWQISRQLNLGLSGRFDTEEGRFTTMDLGLNRDFHCFDAQFNYNKQREEVFLTFNLKAYPQDTATFRYNKDHGFQPKFSTFDSFSNRLRSQADRLRSGSYAQSALQQKTGVNLNN